MKKTISLPLAIAAVLLAVILTFAATFTALKMNEKPSKLPDSSETGSPDDASLEGFQQWLIDTLNSLNFDYEKLQLVDELYSRYYVGELDKDDLTDYLLYGYVAGSGDVYGNYFNAEDFADYSADLRAEFQGIGVNVVYNANYGCIEIVNVMPDSPALEAGVLPGDLVAYVGIGDEAISVSEIGYYKAVSMIQGEAGTMAEFTIYREKDGQFEQIPFSIERGAFTEQTVLHHVFAEDPTIGVVRILSFDQGTAEQFVNAVEELLASGVTRLILDDRNNPGGDLEAICSVLDYLLPEGPVIRIEYKDGSEEVRTSDAKELDIPMAVLVNGNTASAGELFCSALQDYKKATIVGTQTYGKGTMQSIIPLGDGSAVSISVAMYNPPLSDNYESVGVTPDIILEMPEELQNVNLFRLKDTDDPQFMKAVSVLNGTDSAD